MAKKDSKKKDKKDAKSAADDPVAALRAAFERTFSASAEGAKATRERTREIVEEISSAANRVRHTLEDMKVLDEVKRLRSEVEGLASRVASLELGGRGASKSAPAAATPAATKKPAAKRASRASKPNGPLTSEWSSMRADRPVR